MGDAPTPAGPDLAAGISISELKDGVPFLGVAYDEAVILVRRGDVVSAVSATCTHWRGPLAEGLVVGDTVRCPWHHACFHLDTGAVVGAPGLDRLKTWDVIVEGDRVSVGEERTAPAPEPPIGAPASAVIVGAGAAGAACAEALRDEGYQGTITLLGDEHPVDRPNVSKDYLAGTAQAAWMPLRSAEFYEERDIALSIGERVAAIDPERHEVHLHGGRVVPYGALVLATGAEPSTLPIEGVTLPHVFRVRTMADADAILARVASAKNAVVIGASFIGLEVAASLRTAGLAVTVVAPEAVPLVAATGAELGSYVRSLHEAKGVSFRLGVRPARIRSDGVDLTDGSIIVGDLVVLGVGVKPRVGLAEAAGLTVDRGIVVDDQLRTSAADIYAAGDVARFPYAGGTARIEHWVVAMRHGQAIARTLVGRGRPFRDVPYFWSQHYDVPISYVGHAERWDAVEVHGDLAAGDATVAWRDGGRIVAVATVGRDLVSLRVEAAMEQGDDRAVEEIVRA